MIVEPMLLTEFDNRNPAGLLVSEKFDGVRAVWTCGRLFTRHGNEIDCPSELLSMLPRDIDLDGELWFGRGEFGRAISAINSMRPDWSGARFQCFDLYGGGFAARDRVAFTQTLAGNEFLKITSHTRCLGMDHLESMFHQVKRYGGEGLVLRRPMGQYWHGRTTKIQKLKRWP